MQEIAKDKTRNRDERIAALILMGKIGKNAPVDTAQSPKWQKMMGAQQKHSNRRQVRMQLEDTLKNDDDNLTREASAIALGHLKDHAAIPKLKEALNDKEKIVQLRAANSLAKMGNNSGVNIALQCINEDNYDLREAAVGVLGMIGLKENISVIEGFLLDNNPFVRIKAKIAIKQIKYANLSEAEQASFLRETLNDEQYEVQRWATKELAALGDKGIYVLTEVAQDKNHKGNYAAEKELLIIGGK